MDRASNLACVACDKYLVMLEDKLEGETTIAESQMNNEMETGAIQGLPKSEIAFCDP